MNVEINLRKNDRVAVIAGKDKGKIGRVLEVLPRKNRVLVEGVNVVKRHLKPNVRRGVRGGILERESPIHVSNVMVICPHCGVATRVGHRMITVGDRDKSFRACKKCGATIEKQ